MRRHDDAMRTTVNLDDDVPEASPPIMGGMVRAALEEG